jgi:hypothetical protein
MFADIRAGETGWQIQVRTLDGIPWDGEVAGEWRPAIIAKRWCPQYSSDEQASWCVSLPQVAVEAAWLSREAAEVGCSCEFRAQRVVAVAAGRRVLHMWEEEAVAIYLPLMRS